MGRGFWEKAATRQQLAATRQQLEKTNIL